MWAETERIHATEGSKHDRVGVAGGQRLQCKHTAAQASPHCTQAFTPRPSEGISANEQLRKNPGGIGCSKESCLLDTVPAAANGRICNVPVLGVMPSAFPATDMRRQGCSDLIHKCTWGGREPAEAVSTDTDLTEQGTRGRRDSA